MEKKLSVRQVINNTLSITKSNDYSIAMVADAWFAITDLMDPENPIQQSPFVVSSNKARRKDFWKCMLYGMSKEKHKMVLHKSGKLLASLYVDAADMAILTNSIVPLKPLNLSEAPLEDDAPESQEESSEPDQEETLDAAPESGVLMCKLCHTTGSMNPEIKPKFLLPCFHCESLFHQRNCAYRPSPLLNLNFCQRECRYNWTNYAKEVLGTAMTNAEEEEVTAPVRASEPTIKYMLKLPAKHLKELALVHSIDPELSVREIAYRLCGFVQAPLVEPQHNNQPQTQVPSSSSSANSQSTTSSSSATLSTA